MAMTLTLERIAEIEAYPGNNTIPELAELCRLARLGMRVEEAPKTRAKITPTAWRGPTWLEYESLPNEWGGKRVALVVLEDSK